MGSVRKFSPCWALALVAAVAVADSCGGRASTPTSPSASAPSKLTYLYASTIAVDDRQLAERALPEAISNLESSMDWELDHDVALEILDSEGPPTATGGNRTITIYGRNAGWVHVSAARRSATIAHELFHLYQQSEGLDGPIWIREGAAEFFGIHSAYVIPGSRTRSRVLECGIALSLRQPMPPLPSLDTTQEFPYSYATVGIHFLLNGDSIDKLKILHRGGLESFGHSPEVFYARFDEYRRTWESQAHFDCST